jgi:predicted MPP superfamily phosphohydrolase
MRPQINIDSNLTITRVGRGNVYDYELFKPNLPNVLDGARILHAGDFHFDHEGIDLKAYEQYLEGQTFHLVVNSGDTVNRSVDELTGRHIGFLRFLSGLPSRLGHYFVMGNHDYGLGKSSEGVVARLRTLLHDVGFDELSNRREEHYLGDRKVSIYGQDDHHFGATPADFEIDPDAFNILILHNLDGLNENYLGSLDLVLSGHTHWGEVRMFGIDATLYLKLIGDFKDRHRHVAGVKNLSERTTSLITPGMYSHIETRYHIPRIGVGREGLSIYTLRCA